MDRLSIDYEALVRDLARPLAATTVGPLLLEALAERYEHECEGCSLLQFEQSGATYLFDFASAVGAPQEDGTFVDRGHLIPHLSGSEFGPNIFRQHRALNRGWSEQGKRFRALEREAAAAPGMIYFGHLLYEDDSAYPTVIETGLLRGGTLHVEVFRNRLPRPLTG